MPKYVHDVLDPYIYDLGYLTAFHQNEPKYLWREFPHSYVPIPFLMGDPIVEAINYEELVDKPVYSLINLPKYLRNELTTLLNNLLVHKTEYRGYLREWAGNFSCFEIQSSGFIVLDSISNLCMYALGQSHRLNSINFLNPISNNFPPIMQGVYSPIEIPKDLLDLDFSELGRNFQNYISMISSKDLDLLHGIFAKACHDPSTLNSIEIDIINRVKEREIISTFARFQNPNERNFGYGMAIINLEHHLGKAILQVYAWIAKERIHKSASKDKIGNLQDKLYKVMNTDEVYLTGILSRKGYKLLCKALEDLWLSVKEIGLTEIDLDSVMKYSSPTIEEFISQTVINVKQFPWATFAGRRKIKKFRPFGYALT